MSLIAIFQSFLYVVIGLSFNPPAFIYKIKSIYTVTNNIKSQMHACIHYSGPLNEFIDLLSKSATWDVLKGLFTQK